MKLGHANREQSRAIALADDMAMLLAWLREAALRSQLGSRYFPLGVAVTEVARRTVRASSIVENFNSRLGNSQ